MSSPTISIEDALAAEITVPEPGFMDEVTLNSLVSELATQNAVLTGRVATLQRTCDALALQVATLKTHIRALQAVPVMTELAPVGDPEPAVNGKRGR